MPHQNHPSADMLTPTTPSEAPIPLLELSRPPMPTSRPGTPPGVSEPRTRSPPSPPTGPPSPEANLRMLCDVSLLQREELSLRQSLRTRATTSSTRPQGRSATTSPSPRPRLIAFATLSQSVRTVPHLDLSRLDRAMGPQRSWQEVVQRWRDQQLARTQEVQQAHR
jgi:hypothetical protein